MFYGPEIGRGISGANEGSEKRVCYAFSALVTHLWPTLLVGVSFRWLFFIRVFNLVFSYKCGEYNAVDNGLKNLYTIVQHISV